MNPIPPILKLALQEDKVHQDITSSRLIPKNAMGSAIIVAQAKGVLCGVQYAIQVLKKIDPHCRVHLHSRDRQKLYPGKKVLTVRGRIQSLLSSERTLLNILQHLSGIASTTAKYVQAVKGTKVKILDTRKTIPGLRMLQKYAVKCGGGTNHRMNLSDGSMVKDNHLTMIRGKDYLIKKLKSKLPKNVELVIEAKTISEVKIALESNADVILLDNMNPTRIRKCIRFIQSWKVGKPKTRGPQLEASGGITLKNIKAIALSGVHRISVGAITHSSPALDMNMEFIVGKKK